MNGRTERRNDYQRSVIPWTTIQHITQDRLGRTMAVCPLCSDGRRTPQRRGSKVLAVNLIEPEFALYYCNHCGANGYAHPDKPCQIIDLAEHKRRREEANRHAQAEKSKRTEQALQLWQAATAFRSSPAEVYLKHTRGIGDWLDGFASLDQVFRYHPDCPFGGERYPCLIALVRDITTDNPVAIHRTALTKEARPQRISRMSLGPIGGGAIKISADCEVHDGLMIGEGIETALSASKLFQFKPVWSLIDAGNLAKFPALSSIECVTIAVDNDVAGRQAAQECSRRFVAAGIEVFRARTSRHNDFNDLLLEGGEHAR
jgi:hypothetical protein